MILRGQTEYLHEKLEGALDAKDREIEQLQAENAALNKAATLGQYILDGISAIGDAGINADMKAGELTDAYISVWAKLKAENATLAADAARWKARWEWVRQFFEQIAGCGHWRIYWPVNCWIGPGDTPEAAVDAEIERKEKA